MLLRIEAKQAVKESKCFSMVLFRGNVLNPLQFHTNCVRISCHKMEGVLTVWVWALQDCRRIPQRPALARNSLYHCILLCRILIAALAALPAHFCTTPEHSPTLCRI